LLAGDTPRLPAIAAILFYRIRIKVAQ